jgi:lysophospholipase L1-like esterase
VSAVTLTPDRAPWAWYGVAEWEAQPAGHAPRRVSARLDATAHNAHFSHGTRVPAGVRAEVRTDAAALTISGSSPHPEPAADAIVDVVVDGLLHERVRLAADGRERRASVALPAGEHLVEVWLPHREPFVLRELALHDATTADRRMRRLRWLAYGSSITQCAAAHGPSDAWPARVARELGLDLYGLGLGGQCHLDHAIEETAVEVAPEAISLCLGINVYGRGSFDERSFGSAVHGFVSRTLRAHPAAPVVLVSPVSAPRCEDVPNAVGLTLTAVRDTVARVAASVAAPRLTYVDGRDVLGPDDVAQALSDDGLHPTHEGYALMAERLTPVLREAFLGGAVRRGTVVV